MGPGRIKVGRWRTGVWMVRRLGVVMDTIVVMVVKVFGLSGSRDVRFFVIRFF